MGFKAITHCHLCGTSDKGYTTGVANIHNWVRKPERCVKSLNLAVNADIQSPTPRPIAAVSRTRTGSAKRQVLKWKRAPDSVKNLNQTQKARNVTNWIRNDIKLEITADSGITRRGKYTLPNKPALL